MPKYGNTGLLKVEIHRVEHPSGVFGFAMNSRLMVLVFSDKDPIEFVMETWKTWEPGRHHEVRFVEKMYVADTDFIKRIIDL